MFVAKEIIRLISVSALAVFLWQCDGENTEKTNTDSDNTACQVGIDAFKTNIQPAIDRQEGCSGDEGCHVINNTGGTDLHFATGETNAAANRDNLLDQHGGKYVEGSALFDKITSPEPASGTTLTHTGGNQVAKGNITAAAITAWIETEAGCK